MTDINYPFKANLLAQRFELHIGEHLAEINFRDKGTVLYLDRVYVPVELRNRGIAGRLTQATLEWIKEHELRFVPVCPYVVSFVRRHPEWEGLIHVN